MADCMQRGAEPSGARGCAEAPGKAEPWAGVGLRRRGTLGESPPHL